MTRPWAIRLGGSKLRWTPQFARDRTFGSNRPDFHPRTVWQARAILSDRHRFIHAGNVQQKIAADRLLRFRKWTIRHDSVFAGHDFAFALERVTSDGFALVR